MPAILPRACNVLQNKRQSPSTLWDDSRTNFTPGRALSSWTSRDSALSAFKRIQSPADCSRAPVRQWLAPKDAGSEIAGEGAFLLAKAFNRIRVRSSNRVASNTNDECTSHHLRPHGEEFDSWKNSIWRRSEWEKEREGRRRSQQLAKDGDARTATGGWFPCWR